MIMCKSKTLAVLALVTLGATHVSAMEVSTWNNPMSGANPDSIALWLCDFEDDDQDNKGLRTCPYCGINQKTLWFAGCEHGGLGKNQKMSFGKFMCQQNKAWVDYAKGHVNACQTYMQEVLPKFKENSDYIGPFKEADDEGIMSHAPYYILNKPAGRRGNQLQSAELPPVLHVRRRTSYTWRIYHDEDQPVDQQDTYVTFNLSRFIKKTLYGSQEDVKALAALISNTKKPSPTPTPAAPASIKKNELAKRKRKQEQLRTELRGIDAQLTQLGKLHTRKQEILRILRDL